MKNNTWESTVKPIVVLSAISLVISALLAVTNQFTAPVIEANEKATTLAAYVEVMPSVANAADLEEITDYATSNIEGVVKYSDGSYGIKAVEAGFDGGTLTVIMGFDAGGTVTGTWVDASTQTAGIGSHVGDDDIKNQFTGIDGSVNVVRGEGGLDGYSGATISSTALFAAVNDCINCYNEVANGASAVVVEEFVNPTKEEAIEQLAPGAQAMGALPTDAVMEGYSNGDITVFVAEAQGMESKVTVAAAFHADGTIAGIWVDASSETVGLGTKCMEPAFTGLFTGVSDASAVDGIAGATVTSTAVKTAVEACIAGFAAM